MHPSENKIQIYLEIGSRRTFAGAIDWPGWCRGGRDESFALGALLDYGPRYARVLGTARLGFLPPVDVSAFAVVERLVGNASTDFGAPGLAPSSDARPVDAVELQRLQALLQACWGAFDAATQRAEGKELRRGPRGGGRDLGGMIRHVLEGDAAYLGRLAWRIKVGAENDARDQLPLVRQAILDALTQSAHGDLPARGPRGGALWTPRYFVRRVAWHVLDHTWEIEDRIT